MRQSLHNFCRKLTGAAAVAAFAFGNFSALADTMYVSHSVTTNDYVYPYTGFSTSEDVKSMSVAVKLTSDMLAPYAGAKITSLTVGWAGVFQSYMPEATVFLRSGLNEKNIVTGSQTLSAPSGWNSVKFTEPYEIKADQELFMGYTVDMKQGVYGPCTLTYGSFADGTHFISRPDITDNTGNPEWIDLNEPGMMEMACPIMLMAEIEVEGGDYANRALIASSLFPAIVGENMLSTAAVSLSNTGSNPVSSVTLAVEQGGSETWSMDIDLSQPIAPGSKSVVNVPVSIAMSGDAIYRLSKVNGEDNGEESTVAFNAIVVPEATAMRYTRTPLVEYFASESDYNSGVYDETIISPALENYVDRVTRIDWHLSDQFQLGLADDRDEVLDMMVEVTKGDSLRVMTPNVMVDRSANFGAGANYALSGMPTPLIGILYSPFAENSYEYALSQPTFADVKVNAELDDSGLVTVTVSGDADLTVLPKGENLCLTVVLVEDGVESDSQEMPGGSGEGSNPGEMTHYNLVRQRLTDIWGDKIDFKGNQFSSTFTTELDYDNKPADMRAVAIVNRSKDNGLWERNVINSVQSPIVMTGTTVIAGVDAESQPLRPIVNGNTIVAPEGAAMTVCTVSGVKVTPTALPAGIYVVKVDGASGSSATFKIAIR